MMATWIVTTIYLYDILTESYHANYVASRKLEGSCDLLGRAFAVYERIPEDLWPDKPELRTYAGYRGKGYSRIECPATGSFMEAVAEGPDQLRQYTSTNVFCDEAAFWDKWGPTYASLRPTILGGGRIMLVTTPELGAEAEDIFRGI